MPPRPAVVVAFCWGDLVCLAESAALAGRERSLRALRVWAWGYRETRRRGTWRPYTMGDHLYLIRLRRYLRHWPRRTVHPAAWCHHPRPADYDPHHASW